MLPGSAGPADVELADVELADGLADAPDGRATTLVSVPFTAVTVMPAEGSASLAPSAGVMRMSAAAIDALGVGLAVLLAVDPPWPLPDEHAASSRESAATTMPAVIPSR
jgi:hypothetical protein